MKIDLDSRLIEAKNLLSTFLSSQKYSFSKLKPSLLEDGLPVVYAIFDRTDDSTLYVGRTKNLQRRLYTNHLMGPEENARLKKYLVKDESRPKIRDMEKAKQYLIDHCYFKYIPVDDTIRRGQIEGLFEFLLDVRYNHEEH